MFKCKYERKTHSPIDINPIIKGAKEGEKELSGLTKKEKIERIMKNVKELGKKTKFV